MSIAAVNDPILKRFRAELDELYGDRIERVVLFGLLVAGILAIPNYAHSQTTNGGG